MDPVRWARPERHVSLPSTQTEALADAWPGRVVVADHQSAGQGRRGRVWRSTAGAGLAVSAVVVAPPAAVRTWVPLLAGLAAARAFLESRYAVTAALKWPNDVLVATSGGGVWRKIGGVLVTGAGTSTRPVLVIGTGINIDQEQADLPVPTATSWRLARGGAVLPPEARETWLTDYLTALADLLGDLATDPAVVRQAYRQRSGTLGTTVRVSRPDGSTLTGTAEDVDDTGRLLVRSPGRSNDAGKVQAVNAGDVVHVRPGSLPP